MSVGQQDVQSLLPDPDQWSDADLEAMRDHHADPRLRLMAAQKLERRAVSKGLRMAEMQNASDAVLQGLRDHRNPHVQAWAAEEWSRRVEGRDQAAAQNACDADEAAALRQAALQVQSDDVDAQILAEYASVGDRVIKSRRYRDYAAAFKRQTAQVLAKGFCQRVAHDWPGYRVAYESLKFYIRQEITASQLEIVINVHLRVAPVMWQVTTTSVHGQENWAIDDGGAINGWQDLALLMQAHISLRRFRICQGGCDGLFYDASPRGNKKSCGKLACKRQRKRVTKQQERIEKRRNRAEMPL